MVGLLWLVVDDLVNVCCIPTLTWVWMTLEVSLPPTPRNIGMHRPWNLMCVCGWEGTEGTEGREEREEREGRRGRRKGERGGRRH